MGLVSEGSDCLWGFYVNGSRFLFRDGCLFWLGSVRVLADRVGSLREDLRNWT